MTQPRTDRRGTRPVLIGILIAALICAGAISFYASTQPDGLNKVAADRGFDVTVRDHALDNSPLAGYATSGVQDARLSKGLSGVLGVGITLLIGTGVFYLVRRRPQGGSPPGAAPER